jgi:putative membrane protein
VIRAESFGLKEPALTLTAWSARRKQVWTLDRLHPELTL